MPSLRTSARVATITACILIPTCSPSLRTFARIASRPLRLSMHGKRPVSSHLHASSHLKKLGLLRDSPSPCTSVQVAPSRPRRSPSVSAPSPCTSVQVAPAKRTKLFNSQPRVIVQCYPCTKRLFIPVDARRRMGGNALTFVPHSVFCLADRFDRSDFGGRLGRDLPLFCLYIVHNRGAKPPGIFCLLRVRTQAIPMLLICFLSSASSRVNSISCSVWNFG